MKVKSLNGVPGKQHAVPSAVPVYCCCCYFCTSTCSIGGIEDSTTAN